MTPSDLDRDLDRLRVAVEHIGTNLVALEQDPTVALLDIADLRGESAERWGAARVALADLFGSYRALGRVVERATELRGAGRRLVAIRTDELAELLHGRSVVVTGATVALTDRRLLGSSRTATRWTPTALLEQMAAAFDEIRAVVSIAAESWDVAIVRARAVRQRLAALDDADPAPGSSWSRSRSRLTAALDAVAADALADPLGLDRARFDDIEAEAITLERDSAAIDELRDDLTATIATARALLADVTATVGTAIDTVTHARSRIVVPAGLDPIDRRDDLAADLERIATRAAEGRWSDAAAELETWRIAAADRQATAVACAAAHEALLLRRAELRGRLDAYRAKADRDGRLEDDDVTARYVLAHDALFCAPTELDAADDLVHRYREALAVPPAARERR